MTNSSEGDFDTILDDDSLEDTTDELDALEELAGKKEKAEDEDETEPSQQAEVNLLFSSCSPLDRLDISGYISATTFNIITRQHGPSLRALKVSPDF